MTSQANPKSNFHSATAKFKSVVMKHSYFSNYFPDNVFLKFTDNNIIVEKFWAQFETYQNKHTKTDWESFTIWFFVEVNNSILANKDNRDSYWYSMTAHQQEEAVDEAIQTVKKTMRNLGIIPKVTTAERFRLEYANRGLIEGLVTNELTKKLQGTVKSQESLSDEYEFVFKAILHDLQARKLLLKGSQMSLTCSRNSKETNDIRYALVTNLILFFWSFNNQIPVKLIISTANILELNNIDENYIKKRKHDIKKHLA